MAEFDYSSFASFDLAETQWTRVPDTEMRGMSSSSSFILQAASNTLTNYYLILLLGSNLAGTVGRVFLVDGFTATARTFNGVNGVLVGTNAMFVFPVFEEDIGQGYHGFLVVDHTDDINVP